MASLERVNVPLCNKCYLCLVILTLTQSDKNTFALYEEFILPTGSIIRVIDFLWKKGITPFSVNASATKSEKGQWTTASFDLPPEGSA